MKTYNKTHCPDSITWKETIYKMDVEATHAYRENKYSVSNKKNVLVFVLSNNLKGKTDLHGMPYKPSVFVYSNDKTNLPDQYNNN